MEAYPNLPDREGVKTAISSLKRKQMVSPFSLEGDGGGYLFSFDNDIIQSIFKLSTQIFASYPIINLLKFNKSYIFAMF